MNLGDTINLAGGTFTNEGLISPGYWFNLMTTNITGNFVQTSTGTLDVDVDFSTNTPDLITATGTADINGIVNVNIMNPGLAATGVHEVALVTSAGDLTMEPTLVLDTVPSAVATYQLVDPPESMSLVYDINYSPNGLDRNGHSIGDAINKIQTVPANYPNFTPIAAALFYQPTVPQLNRVLTPWMVKA
jgi:hypothetical protein